MLARRQRAARLALSGGAAAFAPAGGGGVERLGCPEDDDDSAWGECAEDALGPPPDCGPVLVRQQATDWTAAREAKAAALADKVDVNGGSGNGTDALRATRLIPGGGGGGGGRRQLGVCL